MLIVVSVSALLGLTGIGSAAAAGDPYSNKICPQLAVSTTTPHVGQSITVTGTDFVAGNKLTLEVLSKPVVVGHATANSAGSFKTSVTLPSGLTGNHLLVALGSTAVCPVDPIQLAIRGGSGVAGENTGSLPAFTGVNTLLGLVVALSLVTVGVVAVRAGRRRRHPAHHSA